MVLLIYVNRYRVAVKQSQEGRIIRPLMMGADLCMWWPGRSLSRFVCSSGCVLAKFYDFIIKCLVLKLVYSKHIGISSHIIAYLHLV